MRRFNVATLLLGLVLALQASPSVVEAEGFGFYPSQLQITDGFRGQRYEVGSVIVNQSQFPRLFKLKAEGSIAPWISFALASDANAPVSEVTVDPNSELPLSVLVDIPAGAENGDYEGAVLMENWPLPGQEFSVIAALNQPLVVTVTGTQKIDVALGESLAANVEVGQPVRIRTQLSNVGNVDIVPTIGVVVETLGDGQAGNKVASFRSDGEKVKAGQSQAVETRWETFGQALGDYSAKVSVWVQGRELGTRDVTFKVVPVGSLGRAGEITAMKIVGRPALGQIARVDVTFRNLGEGDALASFAGQVYYDGVLIAESLSRGEVLAPPNTDVILTTFVNIDQNGKYQLRGRVNYAGAQTDEAVLDFEVGSESVSKDSVGAIVTVGVSAVGIIVVGGAAGLWLRRRRPA